MTAEEAKLVLGQALTQLAHRRTLAGQAILCRIGDPTLAKAAKAQIGIDAQQALATAMLVSDFRPGMDIVALRMGAADDSAKMANCSVILADPRRTLEIKLTIEDALRAN